MVGTPEEQLIDWLGHLDIPVEDTATVRKFQSALERFLNATTKEGREHQQEALTKAMQFKYEKMMPHDIIPKSIDYGIRGAQLRFSIKGKKGWFGISGVKRETGFDIKQEWEWR